MPEIKFSLVDLECEERPEKIKTALIAKETSQTLPTAQHVATIGNGR